MKHTLPIDKNGYEIRPGDVLKVYHFTGARRKQYFMYKIAHEIDGFLYAAHLHNIYKDGGISKHNSYAMPRTGGYLADYEIIEGYSEPEGSFENRKKAPPPFKPIVTGNKE